MPLSAALRRAVAALLLIAAAADLEWLAWAAGPPITTPPPVPRPSIPTVLPSPPRLPPTTPPTVPPPAQPGGGVAVTDPNQIVPNQVLGLYNTAAEAATTSAAIAPTGYGVIAQNGLPALGYVLVTYSLPPGVSLDAALAALQTQFPTAVFAPNNLYNLAAGAGGDPARLISWKAQSPSCGTGISVGVIDTLVDTKVATLKGRDVKARSFVADPRPPTNHGTQVSSILVGASSNGSVPGLMPHGRVVAAGVFEHNASGAVQANTVAISTGMDWVIGEQVNVVNMSFAGPINMALLAVVQRIASKNVLLVAAAGNDGPLSPPLYPAAFPKVIAVSALDYDRNPYPYNVQGKHIAFAAPGVNLPLPVAEAGGRIDLISGTSFAAPYVSGVVALWKSSQPQGGYAEAVDQLAARAIRLRPVEPDTLFGHGLIQSPGPCS
jgi:hypothetical protein